ncbi:MAG TPA: chemotaxis protein CheW [Holophaga sp.]|nr:chemotaxis protein CheW [Holophaga sp.]
MAEPRKPGARQSRIIPVAERKQQYLAFGLGGEAFAMEIGYVKEVVQYGELTEVPLMPSYIRGVISLRGAMVPVIDLSVRFGRPLTEIALRSCVIILEVPRREGSVVVGVIVDNVSEVLELADSEIEPPPAFGKDPRAEFLSGVGKAGEHFVILLDVRHILSIDELAALSGDPGPEVAVS